MGNSKGNSSFGDMVEKVVEELNLPKLLVEKTEQLMVTLLGPSANEISQHLADNFRYRRFKNQVKIFSKAQDLLNEKGITPRHLNLKTLVPLLEATSLEEDESLQEMWASLIFNVTSESHSDIHAKLVKTLSSLTSSEAKLLGFLFSKQEDWTSSNADDIAEQRRNRKIQVTEFLMEIGIYNDEGILILEEFTNAGLIEFLETAGIMSSNYLPEPKSQKSIKHFDFSMFRLTTYGQHLVEKCVSQTQCKESK